MRAVRTTNRPRRRPLQRPLSRMRARRRRAQVRPPRCRLTTADRGTAVNPRGSGAGAGGGRPCSVLEHSPRCRLWIHLDLPGGMVGRARGESRDASPRWGHFRRGETSMRTLPSGAYLALISAMDPVPGASSWCVEAPDNTSGDCFEAWRWHDCGHLEVVVWHRSGARDRMREGHRCDAAWRSLCVRDSCWLCCRAPRPPDASRNITTITSASSATRRSTAATPPRASTRARRSATSRAQTCGWIRPCRSRTRPRSRATPRRSRSPKGRPRSSSARPSMRSTAMAPHSEAPSSKRR